MPIIPKSGGYSHGPNVIKTIFVETEQVIHAGNSDREGQLLVDEVLVI